MIKSAIQEAQELSDKLGFALLPIGKVPATDYFLDFFAEFLMANGFQNVEVRMEWEKSLFPVVVKADFKVEVFPQEQAYWYLQLTKEEYYYLSCILGHLVPAGKISKSLIDKVSLDDLDCSDFDLIQFKGDEVGGYSITINEEKE